MLFDFEQHKYQNLIQKMSMGSYGALTKKTFVTLSRFWPLRGLLNGQNLLRVITKVICRQSLM